MTEENVEVFVCINTNCKSRGAEPMMARLRERLEERGFGHVKVEPIVCFAACNLGPNVVIPSRRCWLSGVTTNAVDDVVGYLGGKNGVLHLQEKNDPALEKMIFEMIDAGLLDRGSTT